ncbi:MAG TPA: hypothetical protein VHB74_00055 [Devosia sp.]|nr:hypothetical protein [Devosia sp.]
MPIRFLFVAAVALCATLGAARAADYGSAYSPTSFNFDGFYLGAQGGGQFGTPAAAELGLVAGANFAVADPVVAGLEFQSDMLLTSSSSRDFDFYALGRAGVVITSDFMAYGEVGPGWSRGNFGYLFGGGGEYALTNAVSVKGELQGIGNWGSSPFGTRVLGGVLFHMQ